MHSLGWLDLEDLLISGYFRGFRGKSALYKPRYGVGAVLVLPWIVWCCGDGLAAHGGSWRPEECSEVMSDGSAALGLGVLVVAAEVVEGFGGEVVAFELDEDLG